MLPIRGVTSFLGSMDDPGMLGVWMYLACWRSVCVWRAVSGVLGIWMFCGLDIPDVLDIPGR